MIYTIPFTLRLGYTSFHVIASLDSTAPGISDLIRALTNINAKVNKMADELTTIISNEATEATALATIIANVQKLQTDLAAALANVSIPPAVQAEIDQAFAASNTNLATVQGLVTSSTEPPPPVAPTA